MEPGPTPIGRVPLPLLEERVRAITSDKRAILVLGMHRSGTSALARTINLLGAAAPQTLMGASAYNERGYWESEPLVQLDDEVMAACGRSWRSTRPMRTDAMPGRAELGRRLKDTIASEFGDAGTIVLKDPRVTRLLPFYRDALTEAGYEILPVIALRNPIEVAKSLARRDHMVARRALGLWLRYTLDAEHDTRGMRRAVVVYEDLLADWRGVTAKMKSQLGGYWPEPMKAAAAQIDTFLAPELRHHTDKLPSGLLGRAALAGRLYREMERLVADPAATPASSVVIGAQLSLLIR